MIPVFFTCRQPLQEICQRIKCVNQQRAGPRILLHTDAAQALGKIPVHACELGVDYLTIVGHKVRNLLSEIQKTNRGLIDRCCDVCSSTGPGSELCM